MIAANGYRSLENEKELRDKIAAQLSPRYDLNNVPGFYFRDGSWRFCAYSGLLIPIRNASGQIQGIQIRRENINRMSGFPVPASLMEPVREAGSM